MRMLHRVAGLTALGLVAIFWTASVIVELSGGREAIAATKQAIAWGLLLLVPAVIAANGSGWREARRRTPPGRALPSLLARKQRRGIAVAVIGLTVLAPCALWLAWLAASAGSLGAPFHIVQSIELAGGAVNFVLLSLNARDGFRMRGTRRGASSHPAATRVVA